MEALADGPREMVDRIERVTAATLREQLLGADPPLLIDVRTPREFDSEHIEGAVNMPLPRLRESAEELPSERELVVHCASGYRSAIAASVLRHVGRDRVSDLVGGLPAWQAAERVGGE
jgi:rhodanese-related sulfurtransferase